MFIKPEIPLGLCSCEPSFRFVPAPRTAYFHLAEEGFTFRRALVTLSQMEGPLGTTASTALPRAWYGASLAEFLSAEPDAILGRLAANSGFADVPEQKDAWQYQLGFLKSQLSGLTGSLYLEFDIPRMGRRIEAMGWKY
jgi:hypothetical protein